MAPDPRRAAQQRADQIRAFRLELDALRAEHASPLTPEQEAELRAHHERLLATLVRDYDIDRTARAGQLSRGLRLASVFGAATLIAAITALVARFWGGMTLPAQVTTLTMIPLVTLAGVEVAARRERTLHLAALFALVACATAWVAVVFVARVLGLPFSSLLLWPGVLFGLAVAASYGFRLVLAASLAALVVAASSGFFAAGGTPWTELFGRLEPLTASAFVLVLAARRLTPFGEWVAQTARLTGITVGLGGLLVLATFRGLSLTALAPGTALYFYQFLMLAACIAVIVRRLRAGDQVGVTTASVFLALFLVVRYVDWFWDALPAWLFFLLLAAAALGCMAALTRGRARLGAS